MLTNAHFYKYSLILELPLVTFFFPWNLLKGNKDCWICFTTLQKCLTEETGDNSAVVTSPSALVHASFCRTGTSLPSHGHFPINVTDILTSYVEYRKTESFSEWKLIYSLKKILQIFRQQQIIRQITFCIKSLHVSKLHSWMDSPIKSSSEFFSFSLNEYDLTIQVSDSMATNLPQRV